MSDIFLGSLVHPVKHYCVLSWVKHVTNLKGVEEILLVETGDDLDFRDQMSRLELPVIHSPASNPFESISQGRMKLISSFLDSNHKYFFSLECDVFAEPHVPQSLASYGVPHVSVPYPLGYIYESERRLKEDMLMSVTDEDRVHMTLQELLSVAQDDGLVKVNGAGFGCSMIERHVVEEYAKVAAVSDTRCDDQIFYNFCRREGVPRYASIELLDAINHYPHFHMLYGARKAYESRRSLEAEGVSEHSLRK